MVLFGFSRRCKHFFRTMKDIMNSAVRIFFTLVATGSFALFALLLSCFADITAGNPVVLAYEWVPALGVNLDFYIDGLALLFALLITGIGGVIFLYSAAYFAKDKQGIRVGIYLSLFALSMLGLVTADNLLTLFVFWELTTLTSFFLIGTKHEKEDARAKAFQALIVTGLGGLAFLAGVILMGQAAGTYRISDIIEMDMTGHALYPYIFGLVALGCMTKSAQFPFHFWLPNAMAAPSPISAYLHSATMVKAGIFILARFHPTLGGTDLWFYTLLVLGGVTAVWASVLALREKDLKLMMAYTTLMALGTITLYLSSDSPASIQAGMAFLLVHALYKATLFLVVGNIEKATGTRDWSKLSSLGRVMPFTAVCAGLAALSMAGIPPFLGFIGKELIYKSALTFPGFSWLVTAQMFVAASLMAAIAFFVILYVFRPAAKPVMPVKKLKQIPPLMKYPYMVLALLGLAMGLYPAFGAEMLTNAAAFSILGAVPADGMTDFKLWHGVNTALLLSILTMVTALFMALRFAQLSAFVTRILAWLPPGCERGYNRCMSAIQAFAHLVTDILQNGRQRFYVMTCFATLMALTALAYIRTPFVPYANMADIVAIPWYQWMIAAVIILGVMITILAHGRLLAICALGVIGTTVAVLFSMFGAPDVAMTQFMVEILVVIIMSIVMLRLPHFTGKAHGSRAGRLRDAIVACVAGVIVTIVMLRITYTPFDRSMTDYYEQNSYVAAHGRNIVNVVLVDFRAMDTLGEIMVVAIAGLACFALVNLGRSKRKAHS